MNIVYALTRNIYHKLLPSITSLLEHNPKASIYILAEDDSVPGVPDRCKVINVSGQTYFKPGSVNYRNQFTYINLLKVCYGDLLPVQKVIHLDVDTIICDSLEPLWKTDIKGKWFAAVPEYKGRYKPFGDLYYNMGVALINLAKMRADNIQPLMVDYLNTVRQPWADQDAWNKYGLEQDKALTIDIRWNENCMTGETDSPAIVHYCSIANWFENKAMHRREFLDRYLPPIA